MVAHKRRIVTGLILGFWLLAAPPFVHAEENPTELRAKAEQGDAESQVYLGSLYATGRAMPKDDAKAAFWFRKAAEQGRADAQSHLAILYETGRGVPQSDAQAAEWLRKSADQGYAPAQNSLGWLYTTGRGVPQDDVRAAELYRKAAVQGDTGALSLLSGAYQIGRGVPRNLVLAYACLDMAFRKGLSTAPMFRDDIGKKLSPAQLQEAQTLASSWSAGAPFPSETKTWP